MSKENLNKFVNSLEQGDNLKANDAFKAAIADKVSTALDDKKVDVAQSMFTGQLGVKAPEANVFSGNNIDDGNATVNDIAQSEVPAETPADTGDVSGEVAQ